MKSKMPDSKERLIHITTAIDSIKKFCDGKNYDDFITNEMLYGAVLYQFMIIGEAIVNVDTDLLKKYKYPWHLPRSFRNYIAHEYFGIQPEIIWSTIEAELPSFQDIIQQIIKKEF
jgi:uncharacterized protein with HEPN domain